MCLNFFPTCVLSFLSPYYFSLKTEAKVSYETVVRIYGNTFRHILYKSILQIRNCSKIYFLLRYIDINTDQSLNLNITKTHNVGQFRFIFSPS
jgi:hypothetical protein